MTENPFSRSFSSLIFSNNIQVSIFSLNIIFQEILQLCCLLSNICKNRRIFLLDFSSIQSFCNWLKKCQTLQLSKIKFFQEIFKISPWKLLLLGFFWWNENKSNLSSQFQIIFIFQSNNKIRIQSKYWPKHPNYMSVEKSSDEIVRFKN